MKPLVSVVIPTHNRRAELERALESVAAQSFHDYEVIVVDDGSEDGTASWLRSHWRKTTVVELEKPRGAAAARNAGIERACGEIIAFLDDDDAWRPEYLQMQVAQARAHPEADLFTTGHVEIDTGRRVRRPDLRPLFSYGDPLVHLLSECPIHTLSVVACRRSVFDRVGAFDENLSIVHDLDWYLRLIAAGGKTVHCAGALAEHSVPGGLVTRHRYWFREERAVHTRFLASNPAVRRYQRRIRAARSLLFARIGIAKGDIAFGLTRLVEAFLLSPAGTAHMAARRVWRYRSQDGAAAWKAEVPLGQ